MEKENSDRGNWMLAYTIISLLILLACLGILIALIVRVNQLHYKVDDIPTSCPSPCNSSSDNGTMMVFETDGLPVGPQMIESKTCGLECPAECDNPNTTDPSGVGIVYAKDIKEEKSMAICQNVGKSSYWFFLLESTSPIILVNDGAFDNHAQACMNMVSDDTVFKECLGAQYDMINGVCVYFFDCSNLMDVKYQDYLKILNNLNSLF